MTQISKFASSIDITTFEIYTELVQFEPVCTKTTCTLNLFLSEEAE